VPVSPVAVDVETPDDGGSRGRVTATARRARDWLARDVFPADDTSARTATLAALAVGLAAALAAGLRLGAQGMNTLWAEDGQVFYAAAKHAALPDVFFHTYRGYMHAGPRTVAAAAALFPVKWAAAGIAVGDAIALGLLAAIVYRASAPFIRNPWLRVVPALLIAACPVGQETIGSIANLQWFLFFAAVVVLLWNPRRPLPIAIGVVTVLFATMSSPFGIFLIPLAGLRLLVFLADRASVIPVAALAGFGMQTLIMVGATGRTSYTTVVPGKLTSLFVSGVVGQGFFGARYSAPWPALGTVAVIAIAAAWALVVATGRLRSFTAASVTLIYALVFFAVPVVLDGMTIGQPPAYRYYVGPLLLIVFAVTVMLDGALRRPDHLRWAEAYRPVPAVLCAALLVCLGYSAVTTYRAPDPARSAPTWSAALNNARIRCGHGAPRAAVPITPVSVHHWKVVLSCSQISRG
jgi:hypothetical protein